MNKSDLSRDYYMLNGPLSKNGYDWWWHSFTGYSKKTKKQKVFFVEYFVMNPECGDGNVVFGQLPENKLNNVKPSYVMIKAGAWGDNKKQIHSFYPTSELVMVDNKLKLIIGGCYLSETRMFGEVHNDEETIRNHPEYMSDAGHMSWDLKINKKIAFNVGFGASRILRKLNMFEMFWHAEGMKTEFSGTVIYDGEEFEVIPEKSFGYADKNWGSNFTSPWVWISSCNMRSRISGKKLENSVIDIGGGRPKVLGIPLNRKLLTDFFYEGKDHEFNFSKFWTFARTKFECFETEQEIVWRIKTQNLKYLLEVTNTCQKEDMLLINYEAPDGSKRHDRLWNGGTGAGKLKLYKKYRGRHILIDDIEMQNVGCEYGEYTN